MAEDLNISISGKLRDFVCHQVGESGLFHSPDEYVRNLIRRDYERQEAWKWDALYQELEPSMNADKGDFVSRTAEETIMMARAESQRNGL